MKTRIILILVLLTGSLLVQAQEKLSATSEQIDKIFEGWTDETQPGIAVGIINDGTIEFKKQWGLANVEHQIPITQKTVFPFPGMVDQLIAFSILHLDELGTIAMDDKLSQHLNSLPKSLESKSIRNLLYHNSGLQSITDAKVLSGIGRNDALNKAEFKKLLNLDFATSLNLSEDQHFTRANIRMLQLVIESVTGKSFAEYAKQAIFEPLGMESSQIASPNQIIKNSADGYVQTGDGFTKSSEEQDFSTPDQLYTTSHDMCLWADNFWRAKLGSQELWKMMDEYVTENGTAVKERNQSLFAGQHRYWNYMGLAKYYLIGQTEGYSAKLIRYPDYDLAVVVLGNFGSYNGHLATMCSDPYLNEFYVEPDYSNKPKFTNIKKDILQKHVGQYWNTDGELMAEVTLENDTLRYFEEAYNWKTNLYPLEENKFYIDVRDGFIVEFKPTANAETLSLQVPGREEILFSKFNAPEKGKVNLSRFAGSYTNKQLGVYYSLEANEQSLNLSHKTKGSIVFEPMSENEFKSSDRQFSRIKFVTDAVGTITGFKLSNANYKDILFQKSKTEKTVAQIN